MLMEAKNIKVSFQKENQTKLFGKARQPILKGVSLKLKEGECLGIIGESGSGKSTLLRVLAGLLKPDNGNVLIEGSSLYGHHSKSLKTKSQNKCSIVFQDYTSSVNPRFHIADILNESLRVVQKGLNSSLDTKHVDSKQNNKQLCIELLEQVGLDASYLNRYPHELSGGQLQRVCIARAIAVKPKIILLDEPISSLDASTQIQVMDLLILLRQKYGFSYLFITHDLTAVTYLCDRVIFFHDGQIVEQIDDMDGLPYIKTPYARELLNSVIGMEILNYTNSYIT